MWKKCKTLILRKIEILILIFDLLLILKSKEIDE